MKETSSTAVLQSIQEWCSSFLGATTILAILAVIGIIIVMAAKESYGKGSFGHRVIRFATIAIYAILAFNLTGAFIAGVCSAIGAFIVKLLSIKWLTTTLLAIIYVIGLWIAYKKESATIAIIISIIAIGGTYGIYQNLLITGIAGGIIAAISVSIVLTSC